MDFFDYEYICKQLAKSISSTVRVYENGQLLYSYSVWKINPDPISPYLEDILKSNIDYGVITTPLFQFYTFLNVKSKYRLVIGPSGLISTDKKNIEALLFEIGVAKENYTNYTHSLCCPPVESLEKTISTLKLLAFSIDGIQLGNEEIYFNSKVSDQYASIVNTNMETTMALADSDEIQIGTEQAYSFELMLIDMIRNGQVDKMKEIITSQPVLKTGAMAHNTLRQMKNECICGATIAARAAIEGGLDCTTAFQLSDLFIQKTELMSNYNSLRQVQWDLFMDYATRVREANQGLEYCSETFVKCAQYVQKNIAHQITVEKLSKHLNISRAYLCTLFKKETQMTLTEYIQKEKILEAQRLIKYTNQSLSKIAEHLAFSSQSHFQTVFKKKTGQTPYQFRIEARKTV